MNRTLSRRDTFVGLAALLIAGSNAPAVAAGSPEEFVKALMNKIISLANSGVSGKVLRSRFASLIDSHVNLRSIASFALGTYQKKLPDKDKSEFNGLVANYAAALFVYYVDDFKGTGIEIVDVSTQGNFTTVKSSIVRKSGEEPVRWRLIKQPNGGYRVSDVNLKGVWMTLSMKKRFNDVLNRSKGDFEILFANLREAETW
jgi:phospholipid transport system substrate-binding protein